MSSDKATRKVAKQAISGPKRVAIYVRVSSEKQAKTKGGDGQEAEEKESPQAQERDCRALAERQGYVVVKVYRDTEKYRVGKKLVEPSGTRSDRPGLRAMLADARKGDFEVILAWREDRLYRSYRPMLDVLDCLEETGVTIELAKEHFDQNLAPVKAWAARMELQAKSDRMDMGIMGRLAKGKTCLGVAPYGLVAQDDRYVIIESEAQWVRLIWQWYGEGISAYEIRRRLIAAGATQRGKGTPWPVSFIRKLIHRDFYHTGFFEATWAGNVYSLPVPVVVDAETAAQVKTRVARFKAYPAGNFKAQALAAGVVYCHECGARMGVVQKSTVCNGKKYLYLFYNCYCAARRENGPGCVICVRIDRIDAEVWGKLWELISVPGRLEAAIEKRVTELQAQEFDAEGECNKLTGRLDDLAMKRQEAIALMQEKIITKADLELRLTSLSFEQAEAERELRDKSLLVGNRAERLMAVATAYREAVVGGAIDLTQEPQTPEEAARVFQFKRKMVEGLVKRVDVLHDKKTRVTFELDFSGVAKAEDLCISDTAVERCMLGEA